MPMRKTLLARIAALALALALTAGCLPASALEYANTATLPGAQNGMVRVWLSSLGNPSTVTVTVSGSYTVNGNSSFTLPSGGAVTVGFSSSTGRLTLTQGGVTSDMGAEFRLCRHATSGQNGLRIAQARVPSNLYPGDLRFVSQLSGGAYKLYVIAYVYIEDYLYGVLPYEMGNLSPIEALKAQAVTARTYTARAMSASGSRLYDVVDTTSDQVYSGTPSGNANCVAAVNATEGVVSMHGSAFTASYYTSSNGGQVESVRNIWGSTSYPYLAVKDDPYDLASPDARVKSFTIQAGAAQSQTVAALLQNKAIALFGTPNVVITGVSDVRAHTPKYATPSRLYTMLDVTVVAMVDGMLSSGTLTFRIFGELETPLGMSLNSTENELWSVTRTQTGFLVQARRYGHGTGMSQRGAMQLANQGADYAQIMAFYFEGCTLTRYNFTRSILSAVVPGQESQPEFGGGTAPDTADAGKGEYYATVNSTASTLNMRPAPSLTSGILTEIARGETIVITEYGVEWCAMRYRGVSGYVMTKYLLFPQQPSQTPVPTQPPTAGDTLTARVNTRSGSLNLRESPSKAAKVLLSIPRGAVIPVYERGETWSRVSYGAYNGHVMTEFLSFDAAAPVVTPAPVQTPAPAQPEAMRARVTTRSGSLNLRENPWKGARVLTTIPRGAVVALESYGADWCKTSFAGFPGYVMTEFLTLVSDTTATVAPTVAPSAPQTAAMQARVTTVSGSLNLRETPGTGARVFIGIPKGAVIPIYERGAAWSKTSYSGYNGYVMNSFLTFLQQQTPAQGTAYNDLRDATLQTLASPVLAVVNSNLSSLNLRRGCDLRADLILEMPKGDYLLVTARGGDWCAVEYNGQQGFCMTKYLLFP